MTRPPGRMLSLIPLAPADRARVLEVVDADFPARAQSPATMIACHGDGARVLLTDGRVGLDAGQLAALPDLALVCVLGAGHDRIDLEAVRRRAVPICYGPGANAESVADHAVGLLLAATRSIVRLDRIVREGGWKAYDESLPILRGRRIGHFGFGAIGSAIARRLAGFDVQMGYHTRRPRTDSPLPWYATLADLAAWADVLIVAAPGNETTRHRVDAAVLTALGPDGYLVNVARGSIVDTTALVEALRHGRIAGAALDVFETEPTVPDPLKAMANVVLSPHAAGRSPASREAMITLLLRNIVAFRDGAPLVTPITATD